MTETSLNSNKKVFIYQICVAFCLIILLVTCQLFQVYFIQWFKPASSNDELFFISNQQNIFGVNSWFVVLIQQISSLKIATIRIIYYVLTIFFLILILIAFFSVKDKLFILFFGLILLGGLSNLISRLRTAENVVNDYFGFRFGQLWNAIYFNLEDVAIIIGTIGIIFYLPVWTFRKGKASQQISAKPVTTFKPVAP